MKKIILAILALLIAMSSFAQIKSATLTASGLTCSMCSKAIYKALGKVPSVKHVDADIEGSRYTITFKDDAVVSLDDLKGAVEKAGFSVASLEVTAHFPPTDIANDTHITYGGSTYHFLDVAQQTISGDKTFRVVDRKFLPDAQYRHYAAFTRMKYMETGSRVYHVTL